MIAAAKSLCVCRRVFQFSNSLREPNRGLCGHTLPEKAPQSLRDLLGVGAYRGSFSVFFSKVLEGLFTWLIDRWKLRSPFFANYVFEVLSLR